MKCTECESENIHGNGLCQKRYMREYMRERRELAHGDRISENKDCPLFLGVYVAERVLSKVFKEVKRMPPKNTGYDFICNKGMKVDVKSACERDRSGRKDWVFRIRKNKIADYFLCLAFDNREDLNPLHIWMLPGRLVNKHTGIGISESTIMKWGEYELEIDAVTAVCNTFKSKHTKE